jgi:fatty-acyl-CoA synthase
MAHSVPPVEIEQKTLAIVRAFVMELGNERASRAVALDAVLDKDLGLGSLERAELLLRLEQNFSVQLPKRELFEAETVQQLVLAVQQAVPVTSLTQRERKTTVKQTASIPTTAKTLIDVLQSYAHTEPHRVHIYLQSDQGEEQTITYGQLLEAATATALGLLGYGLKPGDAVALMLPTSKDFFYAFFGVLLAGGVPVPIYPPLRLSRIEEYVQRQATILHNADVKLLITTHQIETLAHLLKPFVPSLKAVAGVTHLMMSHSKKRLNLVHHENDTALIQYTSGSTGNPKGVVLSHANLLANMRGISQAIALRPTDAVVSWLPLYHDMGLIGAWLGSFYFGVPVTILSPLTFLTQPERWLWAIHTHRATLSAAPNFAYELCVNKIPEHALEGLDLSSWRIAFNGAEAVNPETIARFVKRFSPYGFKAEALIPVYGLAEASVALAVPPLGRCARIDKVSREVFISEHRAKEASPKESSPLQFVSCGVPIPGHEIRIVDEQNKEVPERVEGTLQFRGPSVMSGYFNAPEITQAIFYEGWCDSGDFAYKADGEIFITGRRKDIIIKAGRNFYPQELEEAVGSIPGVRKGCVAAFGIVDAKLGTEKIVLIAETKEEQKSLREEMTAAITEKIVTAIGVPPDIIQLAEPGTIPKTSSGKLRRAACREAYLRNTLIQKNKPSVWMQVIRLWLKGIGHRIQKMISRIGRLLYGAYVYFMLFVTVLPTWLVVLILPSKSRAITVLARCWARTFLRLIGCLPTVRGEQYLLETTPTILVANHASYLDAIVLLAALPIKFVFVAKQELKKIPLIRTFIKKQKHITVDRINILEGLQDIKDIENTLREDQSVLIFPEGTFIRARGVLPFKLGAFKAAVETKSPLCPIAIRGTRYVLGADSWLPRRGSISITILKPLSMTQADWFEMTHIRDAARTAIAHACEEPLLDLATKLSGQSNGS